MPSHYRSGNCWEGRATQRGIEGVGQAINLCYSKAHLKKYFKTAVSSAIKSRLDLLDLATNGHLAMMTKAKMKKFSPPNLNLSAPSALTRMHLVGTGELWQP